jgi:hypothetical protein
MATGRKWGRDSYLLMTDSTVEEKSAMLELDVEEKGSGLVVIEDRYGG